MICQEEKDRESWGSEREQQRDREKHRGKTEGKRVRGERRTWQK